MNEIWPPNWTPPEMTHWVVVLLPVQLPLA